MWGAYHPDLCMAPTGFHDGTKVEKEDNLSFLSEYLAMFCGDLPTQSEVEDPLH